MMRHLERYGPSKTSSRTSGEIEEAWLRCCEADSPGPEVPGDSVYWKMVTNHASDVANWHFSADPKPVDMVWGIIAFPVVEASSGSSSAGPWLSANRAGLRAATTTTRPQTQLKGPLVLTPRWAVKGHGKGRRHTAGRAANFIERGPMRTEYAAPWRQEFTVEVLQAEMAKRSAKWRGRRLGST